MRTGIMIAMLLMVSTGTVVAQTDEQNQVENKDLKKSYLYQWTDDKGVVHITDGLGKVPKKYRDKAKKLETTKKEGIDAEQQLQQETMPPAYSEEEGIEEDRKAEWQQRMKLAKQKLADAEKRYRYLEQQRIDVLGQGGVYAVPEVKMEVVRIEQEMKKVQKEIDDARNEIEVVVPEAARKAGIPPGWLRD